MLGMVARGQMNQDLDFMTGIDVEELSRIDRPRAQQWRGAYSLSALPDDESAAASEDEPASEEAVKEEPAKQGPAKAEDKQPADEKKAENKKAENKKGEKEK